VTDEQTDGRTELVKEYRVMKKMTHGHSVSIQQIFLEFFSMTTSEFDEIFKT